MELNNIEKIIEKYLEAETSIAEEKELRSYFSSENVAPHLEQYKYLFQYFTIAKNETSSKSVPLKPRKNHFKWLTVAASLVLAIGFYTFNEVKTNNQEEEALQAYYQTKEALQLLSSNFNTGTEKMLYLNKFDNTKNRIFKTNH
ncbi:MAG: hypothetical protein HRT69_08995 [Flavobacteriaceae bacterium]|nr:hypothetical protein [Flavobacteriaceae bacterium]